MSYIINIFSDIFSNGSERSRRRAIANVNYTFIYKFFCYLSIIGKKKITSVIGSELINLFATNWGKINILGYETCKY